MSFFRGYPDNSFLFTGCIAFPRSCMQGDRLEYKYLLAPKHPHSKNYTWEYLHADQSVVANRQIPCSYFANTNNMVFLDGCMLPQDISVGDSRLWFVKRLADIIGHSADPRTNFVNQRIAASATILFPRFDPQYGLFATYRFLGAIDQNDFLVGDEVARRIYYLFLRLRVLFCNTHSASQYDMAKQVNRLY